MSHDESTGDDRELVLTDFVTPANAKAHGMTITWAIGWMLTTRPSMPAPVTDSVTSDDTDTDPESEIVNN